MVNYGVTLKSGFRVTENDNSIVWVRFPVRLLTQLKTQLKFIKIAA